MTVSTTKTAQEWCICLLYIIMVIHIWRRHRCELRSVYTRNNPTWSFYTLWSAGTNRTRRGLYRRAVNFILNPNYLCITFWTTLVQISFKFFKVNKFLDFHKIFSKLFQFFNILQKKNVSKNFPKMFLRFHENVKNFLTIFSKLVIFS